MTGITDSGIIVKTHAEIVASLEQRFKLEFGDAYDTSPESPDGQELQIMAAFIHDQWLLAEQAYHSYNPSVVTGVGLDNLVRLNGIERIHNAPTVVSVSFDATDSLGESIPAGAVVATTDGLEFTLLSDVVIPGEVLCECTTAGAIVVKAYEVQVLKGDYPSDIEVLNREDGVTGIVREDDPQLRARRERSLVRAGTATAEAIYSSVADLNLNFIAVLENSTNAVVDDVPPHSIHVVVEGSTLSLVAERVYNNKAIGITAHGDNQVIVTDSQGYQHTIGISRPRQTPVWARCRVVRPSNVAVNKLRKIRDAIVEHLNSLQIAESVEWSKVFCPAVEAAPDINVKSIELSLDGTNWVMTDLPMGVIERAISSVDHVIVEEL